ncbi:MAG: cyclic pyranopterin monophosphate synthase MoaC [Bacillota bacterium]
MNLTHFNEEGRARMVDVTDKKETQRVAKAQAVVHMKKETLRRILTDTIEKGDVFAVAQVAGVQAAKQTHHLIPMCHPLLLTHVDLAFTPDEKEGTVTIVSTVKLKGTTGVEMEALTAVTTAALTVYDMCKAIDKSMNIQDIHLISKSGGKSGEYRYTPTTNKEVHHG